jgi:hypothetical protein
LPEYFTPSIDEWSTTIDSQLTQNLALEVGYNGNRGDHLDNLHDAMNQAKPGIGPIQPRRVWPDFGPGWFDSFNNVSTYHALTVKLTKRFSKGVSGLMSYTHSRALDYAGGDVDWNSMLQNDNNPRQDYGLADFGVPNRLVISGIGQLPFGSGQRFLNRGGLANGLAGGWELSAIISLQSGYPYTVTSSLDFSNSGSASPRPDRVCNGAGPKTVAEWFNTSCFNTNRLAQDLAAGTPTWGDTGRNILLGPYSQEWDVSFIKKTHISEPCVLEFRAEFFNLFNKPNFNPPGSTFGGAGFGVIGSAGAPRDIQFGLKLVF